jgi:hypothetical protein
MLGNAVPSTSLTLFAKDIRMLIRRFDEVSQWSLKLIAFHNEMLTVTFLVY